VAVALSMEVESCLGLCLLIGVVAGRFSMLSSFLLEALSGVFMVVPGLFVVFILLWLDCISFAV